MSLIWREQLAHQLVEHRHRVVRELLAKLDDLSHDQSVATAGVEVVGKPDWRCVARWDVFNQSSFCPAPGYGTVGKADPFDRFDRRKKSSKFVKRCDK